MFPRKKPTNPSRALRPFNANYQPGNPQSSVAPPLVSASNFHASPYGVTPPFTNTNAAQVAVLNNEEPGIPPDLGVIPEEAAAESGKASNKLAPTQMKDGFQALARIPSTGLRGFHEDPDVVDANKEQDREVPEQEYISLFGPRTGSEQKEREVSEREYVSLFGSPAISKYSSLFARTLPANEGKPQAPSEETPFTAQYPPPQDGDYYGRSEAIDLARYFPHEGAVSTNATTGMPIANFAPPVSTMVPMNMLGLEDSGGAIPVPVPPMVMGPLPPSIDPLAYMWRQPSPKQALGPGESLLPPVQTAVTGDDDNISNTHYDTNKPTCSLNLVCYRSGAKGCDLQQMQCALSTLFPSKDAFEAAISVNKELVYLDDQFFTKMRRLYRFKMCGFFRRWCSLKTLRAFKVLAVSSCFLSVSRFFWKKAQIPWVTYGGMFL